MLRGYAQAREMRRTGQVPTRDDLQGLLLDLAKTAPAVRARRFINQMLAEYAAIPGNHALALEFIGDAVDAGLLDLAWMTRMRALDPLRGDPTFEARLRTVAERAERVVEAWRASSESLDEALASLPAGD
jgi:hypothetical protein